MTESSRKNSIPWMRVRISHLCIHTLEVVLTPKFIININLIVSQLSLSTILNPKLFFEDGDKKWTCSWNMSSFQHLMLWTLFLCLALKW